MPLLSAISAFGSIIIIIIHVYYLQQSQSIIIHFINQFIGGEDVGVLLNGVIYTVSVAALTKQLDKTNDSSSADTTHSS